MKYKYWVGINLVIFHEKQELLARKYFRTKTMALIWKTLMQKLLDGTKNPDYGKFVVLEKII